MRILSCLIFILRSIVLLDKLCGSAPFGDEVEGGRLANGGLNVLCVPWGSVELIEQLPGTIWERGLVGCHLSTLEGKTCLVCETSVWIKSGGLVSLCAECRITSLVVGMRYTSGTVGLCHGQRILDTIHALGGLSYKCKRREFSANVRREERLGLLMPWGSGLDKISCVTWTSTNYKQPESGRLKHKSSGLKPTPMRWDSEENIGTVGLCHGQRLLDLPHRRTLEVLYFKISPSDGVYRAAWSCVPRSSAHSLHPQELSPGEAGGYNAEVHVGVGRGLLLLCRGALRELGLCYARCGS